MPTNFTNVWREKRDCFGMYSVLSFANWARAVRWIYIRNKWWLFFVMFYIFKLRFIWPNVVGNHAFFLAWYPDDLRHSSDCLLLVDVLWFYFIHWAVEWPIINFRHKCGSCARTFCCAFYGFVNILMTFTSNHHADCRTLLYFFVIISAQVKNLL